MCCYFSEELETSFINISAIFLFLDQHLYKQGTTKPFSRFLPPITSAIIPLSLFAFKNIFVKS